MGKDQKGFITYGDFEAVAEELTDEQLGQIFRAKLKYFNTGKAPKFTGVLKYVWIPIQQQMDRDVDKYEAKCEKMRANANKRWAKTANSESMQLHANDANTKTNTNTDTKTDRDTNTNTMSAETDTPSLSLFLLDYLNEKTGSNFGPSPAGDRLIQNLLDAGYTQDQMRTVIDKKCAEWLNDPKMRAYLRPSTLFGDKFSEYVSAPIPIAVEKQQDTERKRKSLQKELTEKKASLSVLRSSLDEIPRGTRMDERRLLKDQIAQLEDSIGIIEGRLS